MTARNRLAIGGLGGAAPVLLNLLVVDMVSSLTGLTVIVALAYSVKFVALIVAGAVAGWLHEDELKTAKVFQLGMVAPALLTGMLNGNALRVDSQRHEGPQSAAWTFIAPLHAAQAAQKLSVPQESVSQQIVRGAFGIKTEPQDWVLEAAALKTEPEARSMFAALRKRFPSLAWTLFQPSGGVESWLVTVGGQMTQREALVTREALTPASGLVTTVRQLPDERSSSKK